jgi:hypothetical protein
MMLISIESRHIFIALDPFHAMLAFEDKAFSKQLSKKHSSGLTNGYLSAPRALPMWIS